MANPVPRRRGEARPSTVTARAQIEAGQVEVRRSRRRRRTVSAYRDGDRVVVLLPARMSKDEERQWVDVMLERLAAQERRRRPSDAELMNRALLLCRRYLSEAQTPTSVRWVYNQGSRWGSCTPSDRTVRLSSRLQGMPTWVVDYVLVHELAHLIEPGHTPRFWELVRRYPQADRARGYLEGVAAAASLPLTECGDVEPQTGEATGERPPESSETSDTSETSEAGPPLDGSER